MARSNGTCRSQVPTGRQSERLGDGVVDRTSSSVGGDALAHVGCDAFRRHDSRNKGGQTVPGDAGYPGDGRPRHHSRPLRYSSVDDIDGFAASTAKNSARTLAFLTSSQKSTSVRFAVTSE